jgi:peptide/nickel transport system substrate-binding protein
VLSAYRTDRFEGMINTATDGVPSWWTNYKVHLKDSLGGPFGGTYRWSNSLDIDTFNFMASTSAYAQNVNNMLWDSLIVVGPDGLDVNWLAESYYAETHADNPAVPAGHTRFTFNMVQNATWTDGTQLTAEDVAFTLNFFKEAPGNQYGSDLTDMTAAYATTTYQVIVEFATESFWHLHTVGYKPILPKHVFQEIGAANWNLWNPDPPTTPMVTSGPFNVSEYVAGEFVELTYNPNYFFGPDRSGTGTGTETGATGPDLTLALIAGTVGAAVIIIVGGYVLMRQR